MAQFDLQQEAIFTHLMLCLPLQLLDQTLQQTLGFKLVQLVLQVDGIPAHNINVLQSMSCPATIVHRLYRP